MEMEEDEEEAHNWKEGERIGEAKQPGPPKGAKTATQTPPWNHTPGLRQQQAQAQARWCGTRAVPKDAGEFAKGMYPGPKPSSAGDGPDPRRNTGCNRASVAMNNFYTSRAGTAQHNQGQGRYGAKECRFGENCRGKNGKCPFVHPAEESKQMCKFGAGCNRQDGRCPYQHPQDETKRWCWYGLRCQRRERGCIFRHPQMERQACKFGMACRWKDFNCPFQHQQVTPNTLFKYWDPHLGKKFRQAHPPPQQRQPAVSRYLAVTGCLPPVR